MTPILNFTMYDNYSQTIVDVSESPAGAGTRASSMRKVFRVTSSQAGRPVQKFVPRDGHIKMGLYIQLRKRLHLICVKKKYISTEYE